MNKRITKKFLTITIVIIMTVLLGEFQNNSAYVNINNVQASETVRYKMKKIKEIAKNRTGRTIAEVQCEYPVLKGKKRGIKLINKAIYEDVKMFNKSKKDVIDSAKINEQNIIEEEVWYKRNICKVTYNKNNIISIRILNSWYAGGTVEDDYSGYNFYISSGKNVKLKDLLNKSNKKIKNQVWSKLVKDWVNGDEKSFIKDQFDNIDVNEYKFYIKEKRVFICFDKYEIGDGSIGAPVVTFEFK